MRAVILMRAIIVIACLALLIRAEPAGADPTFSLRVSRHPDVRAFSDSEVKDILRRASAVMRKSGCNVTFTLDGPVRTFTSADVPGKIVTARDLDRVHSEDADVKIVKQIQCCREKKGDFGGCAWPPKANSRSIILTETGARLSNRWAHEFGHRLGLQHRGDERVLMTGSGVKAASVQLSGQECRCFLQEGSCTLPPQAPPAPQDRCPQ